MLFQQYASSSTALWAEQDDTHLNAYSLEINKYHAAAAAGHSLGRRQLTSACSVQHPEHGVAALKADCLQLPLSVC